MKFHETPLAGAFLIEPERAADERGWFARTWCEREAARHGIEVHWAQCNISFNHKAGTLRGMHYQALPAAEAKLVRCTAGAIYDVLVDLRHDSPTFGHSFGTMLSADNRAMLYVPIGLAHGFQTLVDNSEVFYQMSTFYRPELARGVRWDDPSLRIAWPQCDNRIISTRDRELPDLARCERF